ncbi:MAG: hypothetical protein AABX05_02015 [Nanoarchaeota archaeon]
MNTEKAQKHLEEVTEHILNGVNKEIEELAKVSTVNEFDKSINRVLSRK